MPSSWQLKHAKLYTTSTGGRLFKYGKRISIWLCVWKNCNSKGNTDRYGRTIGMVTIDGVNVNEALLEAGLAWHYKTYDKNPDWAKLENQAKRDKRGLWVQPNPIPPWDWRKGVR
jgi:micrococcal nuclease